MIFKQKNKSSSTNTNEHEHEQIMMIESNCTTPHHSNHGDKNDIISFHDILETHPFDADMTGSEKHPVIQTMIHYLKNIGIHPYRNKHHPATNPIIPKTPIIVSLSGGVDSMVIAHALSYLRDHCNYPQLVILAVHIDYGNRPESATEAEYVQHYSNDILKLAECKIRRIDEVTRGVTARDEYEKISRNVRYDLYRNTVSHCLDTILHYDNVSSTTDGSRKKSVPQIGIMLGHHRGDLRENVLSNAHKGCGPLDLSGMTALSQNDGVTIYRPLLPLEKTDIFHYAHTFGVPYFKDTTPHWSTRGKLRNKLMPLLEEIYGDGSMNNLTTLAEESDEARKLLNETVLKVFMDKVTYHPMGISFETSPFKEQGSYFWKLILRDVLHSAGLGMFSDKSVSSFLKRVVGNKIQPGWLQCRKDYAVYLRHDGKVFVFFPESFPWRNSDQYDGTGKDIGHGDSGILMVGPWVIESQIEKNVSKSNVNILLEKKAIPSFESFMDGKIEYFMKVPIHCHSESPNQPITYPLVVLQEFSKKNRPLAWKNTDMKIQSTLPIIGNCADGVSCMSQANTSIHGHDWVICKITMQLSKIINVDTHDTSITTNSSNLSTLGTNNSLFDSIDMKLAKMHEICASSPVKEQDRDIQTEPQQESEAQISTFSQNEKDIIPTENDLRNSAVKTKTTTNEFLHSLIEPFYNNK